MLGKKRERPLGSGMTAEREVHHCTKSKGGFLAGGIELSGQFSHAPRNIKWMPKRPLNLCAPSAPRKSLPLRLPTAGLCPLGAERQGSEDGGAGVCFAREARQ